MIIDEIYLTQIKGIPEHYGKGGQHVVDPSGQCGYFAAGHVMAPILAEHGQTLTYEWVDFYAKQIEDPTSEVGKLLRQKLAWYFANPDARAGAAVDCHAVACEFFARQYDPSYKAVLRGPNGSSLSEVQKVIDSGSVVGYISNLTPSRHFGAIIGYSGSNLIVNDSYGNFFPAWNPATLGKGEHVTYPYPWLAARTPESRGEIGYLWYLKK